VGAELVVSSFGDRPVTSTCTPYGSREEKLREVSLLSKGNLAALMGGGAAPSYCATHYGPVGQWEPVACASRLMEEKQNKIQTLHTNNLTTTYVANGGPITPAALAPSQRVP